MVYHKNGWKYEYKQAIDAKDKNNNAVGFRAWVLTKVHDLNDNYMSISYFQSKGQYYPDTISYTSNSNTGLQAKRFVIFTYDDRNDIERKNIGGVWITTEKRLKNISTYAGCPNSSCLVTRYHIKYEYGSATGRSRIHQIEECGFDQDGNSLCLPPTTFDWTDNTNLEGSPANNSNMPTSTSIYHSNESDWIWSGDYNGDGLQDLLYMDTDKDWYLIKGKNKGGKSISNPKLVYSTDISIEKSDDDTNWAWPADMNGDGKTNLFFRKTDGSYVYFSLNGGNMEEVSWGTPNPAPNDGNRIWIMDVNGDGISDLTWIRKSSDQDYVNWALTNSSGYLSDSAGRTQTRGDIYYTNGDWVWPGDYNGDGNQDLLMYIKDGSVNSWFLTLGGVDGFLTPITIDMPSSVYNNSKGIAAWVADMNGDGSSDFLYMTSDYNYSYLSYRLISESHNMGVILWASSFESGNYPAAPVKNYIDYVWVGDVNGDGSDDLYFKNENENEGPIYVAKSENGKLAESFTWNENGNTIPIHNANGVNAWVQDVDGDGMSDVVYRSYEDATRFGMVRAAGEFPDLLSKVTNSLGGSDSVKYDPMTYSGVYQAGASDSGNRESQALYVTNNDYPYPSIPQSNGMYLVATHQQDDAQGNIYQYKYFYTHGLTNMLGWGWLGFETVTQTDLQTGKVTITQNNQNFPLDSKPGLITITALPGYGDENVVDSLVLSRHHIYYAWTDQMGVKMGSQPNAFSQPYEPNSRRTYQILPVKTWTDYYTYGNYDLSRGSLYTYDNFGNITVNQNLGETDASGNDLTNTDNVYTFKSFINNTSNWRIGYKKAQKVSNTYDTTGISTVACGSDPHVNSPYFSLHAIGYDENMNPVSSCQYDDVNEEWLTTTYVMDGYGNPVKKMYPGNSSISIGYDSGYQTFPDSMVSSPNAQGEQLVQYFGYDPRTGAKLAHQDANGVISLKSLDLLGRLTKEEGPRPNLANIRTSRNNMAQFNLTGSKKQAFESADVVYLKIHTWGKDHSTFHKIQTLQTWTQGNSSPVYRSHYTYLDGLGRAYQTLSEGSDGENISVYTTYTSHNQIDKKSLPFFTPGTYTSLETDTLDWQKNTYDVYQRVIKKVVPSNGPGGKTTTVITYPSHTETHFEYASGTDDAFSQQFMYDYYNSRRKCTEMVMPEDSDATTTYTRDALGRPKKITDPAGAITRYNYDALGRVTKQSDPEKGTTQLAYGDNGKIEKKVLPSGDTILYQYDPLDRLAQELNPDGSNYIYVYDNQNANGLGKLYAVGVYDSVGNKESEYFYGYDRYGRSNTSSMILNGHEFTSSMIYDPLSRQTQYTYPDGSTLNRTFDDKGIYLQTISLGDTVLATYDDFTPFERPQSILYGNGVKTNYLFDETGKLHYHQIIDINRTYIVYDVYSWDGLDRLKGVADRNANIFDPEGVDYSQDFSYEAPGRLVSANSSIYGDLNFGYDNAGNLTNKGDTTYTYRYHQIKKGEIPDRTTFLAQYDDNGNMVSKKVHGIFRYYTYDFRNRLTRFQVEGETNSLHILYSNTDQRIQKTETDGSTTAYFNGMYEKHTSSDGIVYNTRYITGPYGLVAKITDAKDNDVGPPTVDTLYFHQNHLQSTLLTTDSTGRRGQANRIVYAPYGQIYSMTGADNFRPKFNSKEQDQSSGLYYFNARYYDPEIKRFITADTRLGGHAFQADVRNPYAFALNSPVTYGDPSGHNAWKWISHHSIYLNPGAYVANKVIHQAIHGQWNNIAGEAIGASEIAAGVALDAATFGGSATLSGTLIGAGTEGLTYSMSAKNFSWGSFGKAEAVGAAVGFVTGGLGELAEAGGAADALGGKLGSEFAGKVALGAGIGAAGGVTQYLVGSAVNGTHVSSSGVGWAALEGGISGGMEAGTSAAGESIFGKGPAGQYASNMAASVASSMASYLISGVTHQGGFSWSGAMEAGLGGVYGGIPFAPKPPQTNTNNATSEIEMTSLGEE